MTRKYIKGKDGRVEVGGEDLEVTQFEGQAESDMESFGSSATGGFKVVVDGNSQASGSCQGKLSSEQIVSDLLQEGDEVALKLFPSKQTAGTNKRVFLDVPTAKISNLQYGSDPNGGGGASFTFNWLSSGEYSWNHTN